MHVGIIGHGTWLPNGRVTAAELAAATGVPEAVIAVKFGVKEKPVAGPGETTAFMGLAAARKALDQAGVDPSSVDLVIWCGAQHKDYPCWLAGLYVADQLGAKKAWSFDMEAMCGSMMAALDVAKSLMLARQDLDTVLLVSGYRNNDLIDISVPETRFMMDIGSGGSALVLRKNAGRNAVLASAFRGDGSLSEMCVVPALGSKAWPPAPGDEARAHFVVPDEEAFKAKLGEVTMPNFYAVIRESMRLSGFEGDAIDYLAILHFKRSAHDAVLAELGLRQDQTTYLDDYGHVGQNDQVLSLELGLRDGKIQDGSRIVFVGAGLGFVWASTVIQWGPWQEA
ncbi:3-oxoacyl-ACP synthase [Mesoterricola sediminis]|uniref:3-oxoacyl-[acyl-carrier-protein] synthase 3 n=1 Tax=Mesoterricola sediminis TaxID=2927980 RepID=A0AA48GTX6_9BACT|nr:3-oxoacyl-ACP synthase [Mesoterricola sediminis]BDU77532.1 3-oxoacyl-[acyl-carrier-protein] synthase 3 [Mesoterricola sediminis]